MATRIHKSPEATLLTDIMLAIFRANGILLEAGDGLVRELHLTSSRWQILGAIAMSSDPATAPRIAAVMGLTRQGAQKQLNVLMKEQLIQQIANPGHQKSPMYALTRKGERVYGRAIALQTRWSNGLAEDFSETRLRAALGILQDLTKKLQQTKGAAR